MKKLEAHQDLYHNNAFYVCHVDRNSNITLVSEGFTRLLNRPELEILNSPFTNYLRGSEIAKFKSQLTACLQKGGNANSYYRFYFLEKHSTYIKLTTQHLSTLSDPNPICRIIIVDLADSEFTKMDFYLNRKRLDRINKTDYEGRLIGGMAHDYNDIISAILLNIENISEMLDEDSDVWEEIQLLEKMAKKGSLLTKQLLDFSRTQVEKLDVLNLNKVLIDMYSLISRMAGEDVEVTLHTDSCLGQIKMDSGQLENIIYNLAINSIEALDKSPKLKKINIETEACTLKSDISGFGLRIPKGEYSVLMIEDNGVSPGKEDIQNLAKPNYTHKQNHEGLGLTIVVNALRSIGGGLEIAVKPSGGTKVRVYFPTHVKHYEAEISENSERYSFKDSGLVLLVEDDKAVRKTIARVLNKFGYEVLEAANFKEAMEPFMEHHKKIKFVLTDVIMPKTSGPEMIQTMLSQYPETCYLFTSGYTEKAFTEYAGLLNHKNFLQKPFSVRQLAQKVKGILTP